MKSTRKRLDGVEEVVTKQVEVSRLVEPKFLTLTKMPAGQVAFKVVRGDKEKEETMSGKPEAQAETRRRRIRSTQRSSLLYIAFPGGTTKEQVEEAVKEYGIDGYALVEDGDTFLLRRNDLTETPQDALTIQIGDGRKAGIVRTDAAAGYEVQDPMPHVSVIAIDFNKEVFATQDAVMEYLQRHDIDFLEKGVENADTVIRVLRTEASPDAETRRVQVEDGVVAVVARSAVEDLVDASPFIEVVSETAYGQWGWGQLDFAASMADKQFCSAAEDSTYTLRRVVEDILFYSQLPVGVRKELIARAAAQFSAYIGTLLDALPAQVVLINRSNLEKLKESGMNMKTATTGAAGDTTLRTDETAPPADTGTPAPADQTPAGGTPPAEDSATITRGEVKAMITEAVAAAVAAVKPAAPAADTTQRTDAPPDASAAALKAFEEVVTRSVSPLADAVKAVTDRMAVMEGATTLRSDSGDSGNAAPKDPFVGVFSQNLKSK